MSFENILTSIVALLVVLGLLGAGFALVRRFNLMPGMATGPIRPGRDRRLKVIETLSLDSRRRVVLIRQDDKEHLLLLGMNEDRAIATEMAALPDPEPAEDQPVQPLLPKALFGKKPT